MKNIILLLLIVLVSSCGIRKKMVSSNAVIEQKTKVETSLTDRIKILVDTTKSDELEVTYSKTEYYPRVHPSEISDSTQKNVSPDQTLPAIKSVETFTVREKTEKKGIAAVEQNTAQKTAQTDTTRIVQQETATREPGKDPKRFRYIFWTVFLIVISAAVFFLVKKKDKIPAVRSVLSWIRGILKI